MRSMAELSVLDAKNQADYAAARERRGAARRECGPPVSLGQPSPLDSVPSTASGEIRLAPRSGVVAMVLRRFMVVEFGEDGERMGAAFVVESPLSPAVLAV